jgi:predicted Zn-dependent protease
MATLAVLATGCQKNDVTGRRGFNAIPDGVMKNLGESGYREVLASSPVQQQGQNVNILQRVGQRISGVVDEKGYAWEFSLINEPTVNAWCMPGGYIGFYDGILPVLRTEAGMAFVMGHEVAHATAKHSAERMTQQLGVAGALTIVQAFLAGSEDVSEGNKQIIFGALGLGAEVGVILPFSRKHESEADVVGLMYMADAGYQPGQSVGVWRRMDRMAGERPPEFLSTHPAPDTRIAKLEEWMPAARKRFRRNIRQGEDNTTQIWGE